MLLCSLKPGIHVCENTFCYPFAKMLSIRKRHFIYGYFIYVPMFEKYDCLVI